MPALPGEVVLLRGSAVSDVIDFGVLTLCPSCECADLEPCCWFCGTDKAGARAIMLYATPVRYLSWMTNEPPLC